ncbi:Response regulator of zinc sigma-54-dependent two-component system [Syntrophobacter sp. SbD1]|nr:Response regulator of zinc sigma-54-dependent two-component system [Syntrophobacter sp. SbD1]
MVRILIVDDESDILVAFKKQLTRAGMDVLCASCASEAISMVKKENFDVAVLDIKLPDLDGIELLLRIKQIEPAIEIIMLTGFASIETAIRSLKQGAYDYLTKPCKIVELKKAILKAYEKKILREKNIVLEEQLNRIEVYDRFIGESKQMQRVRELISVAAPSNIPVLIQGETGTGKELTARAIHDRSQRAGNPFVAINSSALPETIFESELFGYKKGAFTGAGENKLGLLELANGGTLFADEVSDMGLNIQAKLLRVLETGTFVKLGDTKETKVDIRFVFATNRELRKEVEEGRFRKDLLYRVNAFVIYLPPLREKTGDIPSIVDYFLKKFTRGNDKKVLSEESMALLASYDWPGNVRELKNVLERAVLLSADRQEIITRDFPEGMLAPQPGIVKHENKESGRAKLELDRIEIEHVENVLRDLGGNKTKAAQLLGITRATLYKKIRKHVVTGEEDRTK